MKPISAVTRRISPDQRALAKQVRHHHVDNPLFASVQAIIKSNPAFAEQAAKMVSDMVKQGGPEALKLVKSVGERMGIPPGETAKAFADFRRQEMRRLAKPTASAA